MLTTNPKSSLQKKLQDAQTACAHILILAELVQGDAADSPSTTDAIGAGIKALANQIDSEIDDVHRLLSKAEAEVAKV